IAPNAVVAVAARAYGAWWLNACRIADVTEPHANRCGFTYSTLPSHFLTGHEQFLVTKSEDGSVWYELRAVSRPRALIGRVGLPLTRRMQRKFARDSQRRFQQEVRERCRDSSSTLRASGPPSSVA
ncbi:MAG: DUF1990 family protein, partial [Planctomycetota bacterium]